MMKAKTIQTLKQLFDAGQLTDHDIALLKSDHRKGVQQIIKQYEKQKQEQLVLEQQLLAMMQIEQQYYKQGYRFIAGVDEAGRGPLAGPVVAAAVILPEDCRLLGLNDSKQLSERKRQALFEDIKRTAVSFSIAIITNEEIDELNIYEATKKAMAQAIKQLDPKPDHILIDAVPLELSSYSTESIVKGDQRSISIAAASILAKVTRDQLMKDIHKQYPMYQFDHHMGYGTKQHLELLRKYGPSPFHRKSFQPVRQVMSERDGVEIS